MGAWGPRPGRPSGPKMSERHKSSRGHRSPRERRRASPVQRSWSRSRSRGGGGVRRRAASRDRGGGGYGGGGGGGYGGGHGGGYGGGRRDAPTWGGGRDGGGGGRERERERDREPTPPPRYDPPAAADGRGSASAASSARRQSKWDPDASPDGGGGGAAAPTAAATPAAAAAPTEAIVPAPVVPKVRIQSFEEILEQVRAGNLPMNMPVRAGAALADGRLRLPARPLYDTPGAAGAPGGRPFAPSWMQREVCAVADPEVLREAREAAKKAEEEGINAFRRTGVVPKGPPGLPLGTMVIEQKFVDFIIGPGGQSLAALNYAAGVTVHLDQSRKFSGFTVANIYGPEDSARRAKLALEFKISQWVPRGGVTYAAQPAGGMSAAQAEAAAARMAAERGRAIAAMGGAPALPAPPPPPPPPQPAIGAMPTGGFL